MQRLRGIGVVALLSVIAGCAESTMIKSYPVGARISVNGVFVGASPAKFVTSREQFDKETFVAVAEQPGYQRTELTLQRETCRGRIVGAVFTLGILLLFKHPTCFESPQYIDMPPLSTEPSGAQSSGPPRG